MMRKSLGLAARILAVLFVGATAAAETAAQGTLEAGMVLSKDNWQLAENLLPSEILKHYRQGEYINKIVDWPVDHYVWPTGFAAGSKANEGRFDIGENGEVIDKQTGKQPLYLIGFPFPTIDPKDPKAAAKILWNTFYRTWYFGNARNQSQLNWINARGLERRTDVEVGWKYFDGTPLSGKEENTENLSAQFITVVTSPADMSGTSSLTWRYRDPGKRDSTWSFVPALRRVRAVSPSNRSDGFLGSDMSQDDGPFFDGKPEDFTWTLQDVREQLRLVDPLSLAGKGQYEWLPTGGWRAIWPDLPFLGYMDPKWQGNAWASVTGALAKREHWVIAGVPKDRYYLYGKMEMYIDKVTFQGSWNRKFDWKGALLNTYQVMAFIPYAVTRADGQVDFVQGSNMAFQCSENITRNQATVAGIKSNPKSGFDSHFTFEPGYFDVNSLSRFGK